MAGTVRTLVPPQHGAWAFLALPLLLAVVVTPWSPVILLLGWAWVAAYPWSYAALGLVRTRRSARFGRPLLVWSIVLLPAALLLLVARPWLVWVGLALGLLFAVNLWYARRHDERALLNDVVVVAECACMVVVTWAVAVGDRSWVPPAPAAVPEQVWLMTALCALVLLGSTLHVKSLLRERGDPRYARAARAVAWASVVASLGLAAAWGQPRGWWLVVPFPVLAGRAELARGRSLRPARIGMIELGCFVAAVVAAVLAAA